MVSDLVSDMLTRIRNSYMVKHRYTTVIYSKLNEKIAQILKREGFIKDYNINQHKKKYPIINIYLKYKCTGYGEKPKPILKGIKRISKPGLRVYSGYKKLPQILENLGIAIISTSEGLMTNYEARHLQKGGEIICFVW